MTAKPRKIQHERKFLTELKPDWELLPCSYFEKIPDTGGNEKRFKIKRPYDFIASAGGKFFAVEAKYSAEPEMLLAKVKNHQWEGLARAARGGYRTYILCCYMLEGKVSAARFFDAFKASEHRRNSLARLPNSDAVLTIYRMGGRWQIDAEHIKKL